MSAVQRIKAVPARNLAVKRSRMASMPEVGIFWLIDNKLVADSIPWPQADFHGGFYNGKNDHATFWTTLQRLVPQWKGKEYTDFPRGRVLLDAMKEVFLVFLASHRQKPGCEGDDPRRIQTAIGSDEIRGGLSLRERDAFHARRGL
jgi:hypothetical protein